ncbi:hypothetical protein [Paraburkholderia sp.]|uniref:hypothetical protein n=1 Tax=Paraburkholderia sp. TaxID=1926495 RepID=UPI002391724E|nr:hypothetical protein [Paraburkholderia sp.]MDE1183512.1 hypothetical protein [Paraburkholderia sp.]
MKARSLIVALLSLCSFAAGGSSAFADTAAASIDADSATLFGAIALSATQDIGGTANAVGTTSASVGADALAKVSGNVGVNVAAGALNVQANQIALLSASQPEIDTQQSVHGAVSLTGGGTAMLGAGALNGASGNIGVNIASGAANAQINSLAVR